MGTPTNAEPHSVLDTVMPNVPMTWSGSVEKLTVKNGPHLTATKTPELDSMAHAALKWTSGKLTASPKPTLLTLAPSNMLTNVKELNVVTMLLMRDTTEFVTRMDVILDHGVWEITNTMDLDLNSKSIPPSHSPL